MIKVVKMNTLTALPLGPIWVATWDNAPMMFSCTRIPYNLRRKKAWDFDLETVLFIIGVREDQPTIGLAGDLSG